MRFQRRDEGWELGIGYGNMHRRPTMPDKLA